MFEGAKEPDHIHRDARGGSEASVVMSGSPPLLHRVSLAHQLHSENN